MFLPDSNTGPLLARTDLYPEKWTLSVPFLYFGYNGRKIKLTIKNMNRRILTKEQIKKLSQNKNVSRCGSKSVRYTKEFKKTAIQQYNEEGLAAVAIFESAGFDLEVIGKRMPNKLMHQWNKVFRMRMAKLLSQEERLPMETVRKRIISGREFRTLKAKVAYLTAENDFLAELRARKRKSS